MAAESRNPIQVSLPEPWYLLYMTSSCIDFATIGDCVKAYQRTLQPFLEKEKLETIGLPFLGGQWVPTRQLEIGFRLAKPLPIDLKIPEHFRYKTTTLQRSLLVIHFGNTKVDTAYYKADNWALSHHLQIGFGYDFHNLYEDIHYIYFPILSSKNQTLQIKF